MTESDARAVLLVRAAESEPPAASSDADAAWAGDEARRRVGEHATFEAWLVQRAQLLAKRLADRAGASASWLQALDTAWVARTCCVVAFVVGVASDALGARRINILAPPLLALLAWNLVVYVVLVAHPLVSRSVPSAQGPLRRGLLALVQRWLARANKDHSQTWSRFVRDWASAARPLYAARVAAALHGSAAALVLGALVSFYLRGLAFEYRAGWQSTFLNAADVHAMLAVVIGPAAWLSGIALPSVQRLDALRFSAGSGENAANWIHLYAITLALLVLVPRTLLAVAAAVRARRWRTDFPLPLDHAYFGRLRAVWSGQRVQVRVVPYSYTLDEARRAALSVALDRIVAPGAQAEFAPTVPLGAEDDPAAWLSNTSSHSTWLALFPLTATPEREHHGAFVQALDAGIGRERLRIAIDESGFRERFGAGADNARLAERRLAWQALLRDQGYEPVFVDLARA